MSTGEWWENDQLAVWDPLYVKARGHLPVFAARPVALDPRTKRRARVGLRLHCAHCNRTFMVRRSSGPVNLVWRSTWLRWGALRFDPAEYWAKPEPGTIDWSKGRPEGPTGMWLWQFQIEGCAAELNRCASASRFGHGRIGGETTWRTQRCVLADGHAGGHEAPDPDTGAVGWSHGLPPEMLTDLAGEQS